MYCSNCGAEVNDKAVVCPNCGCAVEQKPTKVVDLTASNKDWLVTLLLCLFVGGFGAHRFYVGKTGTGVAQLLTCGMCGIWTLIDLVNICMGNFTDSDGKVIKNNNL